jgi:hypothetical protein
MCPAALRAGLLEVEEERFRSGERGGGRVSGGMLNLHLMVNLKAKVV